MVFAALMSLVGGLLPALGAARLHITRALRDAKFRPYQSGRAASERTFSRSSAVKVGSVRTPDAASPR